MKKSASSDGATRITPAAPTPRCRSHRAATSDGARSRVSSRSSIITKSLPVPWYLAKRNSPTGQVLHQFVGDAGGSIPPGLEPADAGIPSEPRQLTPGERLRALDRAGDRLVERALAAQIPGHLSVPDGLARGQPSPETAIDEPAYLVDEP